jgi:hypothetical protein
MARSERTTGATSNRAEATAATATDQEADPEADLVAAASVVVAVCAVAAACAAAADAGSQAVTRRDVASEQFVVVLRREMKGDRATCFTQWARGLPLMVSSRLAESPIRRTISSRASISMLSPAFNNR